MNENNKNILKLIIKLLVFIFIVGFIALIIYFYKKNINNSSNTSVEKITGDVSLNNKKIIKLFNDMNSINETSDLVVNGYDYLGYFYSKDKIVSESLDDNVKFGIAFKIAYDLDSQIEEEKTYDSIKVENNIKNLFGRNSKIKNSGVSYNISSKKCFYSGNIIDCQNKMGSGSPEGIKMITKMEDVYKENDNLIIINKVMFVYSGPSDNIENSFKYNILKKYTREEENNIIIDTKYSNELLEFDIDNYLDNLYTYKWTFKMEESGKYIFDSVELQE